MMLLSLPVGLRRLEGIHTAEQFGARIHNIVQGEVDGARHAGVHHLRRRLLRHDHKDVVLRKQLPCCGARHLEVRRGERHVGHEALAAVRDAPRAPHVHEGVPCVLGQLGTVAADGLLAAKRPAEVHGVRDRRHGRGVPRAQVGPCARKTDKSREVVRVGDHGCLEYLPEPGASPEDRGAARRVEPFVRDGYIEVHPELLHGAHGEVHLAQAVGAVHHDAGVGEGGPEAAHQLREGLLHAGHGRDVRQHHQPDSGTIPC
mmetsp:Transcript_21068/g.70773  ORF Transcript_21068/g.70773 Transcript_21068/m.70773 type:complete len:259 (+) Transcript_21068:321-1097(+)